MPTKVIARQLRFGRNTVRRALAAESPPKYQWPTRGSVVDEVESQIRELLEVWRTMGGHLRWDLEDLRLR